MMYRLLYGALLLGLIAPHSQAADFPKTTEVNDQAYVALPRVARFYGFSRPRPDGDQVTLGQGQQQIVLTRDSRRALINGVHVWLHEPIVVQRRMWLISETDLRWTLDPLLRPTRHLAGVAYRVIVLDPGHGGRDEGGRGAMGSLEKEMVMTIARKVAALLEEAGQEAVVLTRTDDRYLALEERVAFAVEHQADLFVSIHFNTSGNKEARGSETFVLTAGGHPSTADWGGAEKTFPPSVPANDFDGANMLLGYLIHKNLVESSGNEDRGIRRSRFYVLREARTPAVLVECAFLTNAREERNVQRAEYQDQLARGIAQGVLEYLGAVLRAQLEDAL